MASELAKKSIWVNFLGAEIKFIQGSRYRIRIAEAGKEHPETLLMVHGGGGHIETFARNVVPLGEHFHTIGLEMLWHGMTDAPPMWDHMNAQTSDAILDLMDTMGLDKVWIHGEAGGASGMTPLVLNHPERLKGVIFESGIAMQFKEGALHGRCEQFTRYGKEMIVKIQKYKNGTLNGVSEWLKKDGRLIKIETYLKN